MKLFVNHSDTKRCEQTKKTLQMASFVVNDTIDTSCLNKPSHGIKTALKVPCRKLGFLWNKKSFSHSSLQFRVTSLHSEWLEVQPPKQSIYFVFRSWIHLKDCVRQVVQSYTFIVADVMFLHIVYMELWKSSSGWWFQVSTHLKNMLVKLDHLSSGRGKHKKSLSCHHLVYHVVLHRSEPLPCSSVMSFSFNLV